MLLGQNDFCDSEIREIIRVSMAFLSNDASSRVQPWFWVRLPSKILCGVQSSHVIDLSSLPNDATTSDVFSQLELAGLVFIRCRENVCVPENDSSLVLSGGSVCTTVLDLPTSRVNKTLSATTLGGEDGLNRHVLEFKEMASASRGPIGSRLGGKCTFNDTNTLSCEFLPGYSFGERVLREELTMGDVSTLVLEVLEFLRERVWNSRPAARQRYYKDVIERRYRLFPRDSFLRRIYDEPFVVNGAKVEAIKDLLVKFENRWPFAKSMVGCGAHGDLILEDIVVLRGLEQKYEFALIDPNPQNTSWALDYAKLLMSFWLDYESILVEDFVLSSEVKSRRTVDFTYEVRGLNPEIKNSAVQDIAAHFHQSTTLPHRNEVSLRFLFEHACLNMLALPTFHSLHHRSESRATVFAVHAAKLLSEMMESSRLVPLPVAV